MKNKDNILAKTKNNQSSKYQSIEGARAIGAFVVFMWHLNGYIDVYFKNFTMKSIFRGDWANVFFFCYQDF